MQLAALKHRPESEDAFAIDLHTLKVRFHTAKDDVKEVIVHYTDNYLPTKTLQAKSMDKVGVGQVQDHFEAELTAPYRRLRYIFEVLGYDGEHVLVGDRGIEDFSEESLAEDDLFLKFPYIHQIDMIHLPAWIENTVWYQIFPERFANEDAKNDPDNTKLWNPEDHPGRDDFYGGDLQGIIDHLDYLQRLGVTALYLCPIFKASSNHKYDTIDYFEIDPHFGDKKLFKQLVDQAHQRGMKIMLDAVFNHLGDQSLQWQDVMKYGKKSRFYDWFHIYGKAPDKNNLKYDTFAFEKSMPKINTANPEVQDYLLEIATYWIKNFDIDAWRLDVANEIDHHFWRKFHSAVTQIKPDFYILGEIWHNAQPWLNGDQFSGVMNYPLTLQISDHFFTHHLNQVELTERLTDQMMRYRDLSNQAAMNSLDTHDTARILTRAGNDQALALQALAFMFLQVGAPCIYYGTEMGMSGGKDPDCRKPMNWNNEGSSTWKSVQELVAFRHEHHETLSKGKIRLSVTPDKLIKVERSGIEKITAYFNTAPEEVQLDVNSALSQNYHDKKLFPKGYVISIDKQ